MDEQFESVRARRLFWMWNAAPETEHAINVPHRLSQRVHALSLRCRLGRRRQRAPFLPGSEPVVRQLGCGGLAGVLPMRIERGSDLAMQLQALADQRVVIDRFTQQRMAEHVGGSIRAG